MEVKVTGTSEISVTGNIKTMGDYQEIKRVIQEQIDGGSSSLTVKIPDSFSITSSVIGYFLKVINKDNVSLSLQIKDDRLYKILKDLNLIDIFNVKKM